MNVDDLPSVTVQRRVGSLRTLIVGAGRAGCGLHLQAVLRARERCRDEGIFDARRPLAVDPCVDARRRHGELISVLPDFAAVADVDPTRTVVHLCTPPLDRTATLEALAAAGFRNILIEKPLACSSRQLRSILHLAETLGLDLGVVSPWLSSALTQRLLELVNSEELGRLQSVVITQRKPRFTRTLLAPHHPTAFETELPHSVSVAILLAGADSVVIDADCHDMHVGPRTLPHLAGASVRIRHASGALSWIDSDLTAPDRRRSIELEFEDARVWGHYSVSSDDHYAQLAVRRAGHLMSAHELLHDDPFERMVIEWYRYWAGSWPRPMSDLAFNRRVVELIAEGKRLCGVDDDARLDVVAGQTSR